MAIKFSCGCGRAFAVADDLAGKWTRCSACDTKLQVPAAATADDGGFEVVESPPAPAAANIAFKCGCGQPLEVEAAHAGQEVECPTCAKVVRAPAAGPTLAKRASRPLADEPPPRPRRRRRDEDDEQEGSVTDEYMRDARRRLAADDRREARHRSEHATRRTFCLILGIVMMVLAVLGGLALIRNGGRWTAGPVVLFVFGLINVVYGLTGQEE